MTILNDKEIIRRCEEMGMITPFVEGQVRKNDKGHKVISYGVSSYGYDIRVSDEYKIFTNVDNAIVDPKNFSESSFVDRKAAQILIPPNSFVLCRSVEHFHIPRDLLVICVGKSTYARVGLVVNVTPLEPLWEGYLTIEISNTTPLPARVYSNEGIAQLIFMKADEECQISYAEKGGKYQGQTGVTPPRM